MSWINLTTAPDQIVAEMWSRILRDHGVPAMVRAGDTSSFMGVSTYPCRVIVSSEHVGRAWEVLRNELGIETED
ncbi:DUF2007 domain-containing protein [Dehalococcoidia bacterium]|nr:DUF2007 domain-containing protein [Dehalococcoidia bacterium]